MHQYRIHKLVEEGAKALMEMGMFLAILGSVAISAGW